MLRTALRSAAVCALTAALVLPASPAVADDSVAWSMQPVITDIGEERTNFAYALDPGAVVDDAVLVRNSSSSALVLEVGAADAFTNERGELDIVTSSSTGIGAWVVPAFERIELAPGEQLRVPFEVRVPADATPGEHAGALLTVSSQENERVAVDMRYATRVTVAVSGELTAGLDLDGLALEVETGFWPWEPARGRVSYTVENTGNTRLTAPQLIETADAQLYSSPDGSTGLRQIAELLPGAAVNVEAEVDGFAGWSPVIPTTVSVAPTALAIEGAEPPAVAQVQASTTTTAVAPGWWVLLGGILALVVAAVATARRITARRTARDDSGRHGIAATNDADHDAPLDR